MDEIVCATRGGEGSRAVQQAAIDRAKETGKPLVFLYVVSLESVNISDPQLEPAVQEELTWMGKALLRIAQRRAHAANVDAAMVVREGNVAEEITRYLTDHKASVLLIGATRDATANVFGDDAVERFAQRIRDSSNVKVEIIHPEPLSQLHRPGEAHG